MHAAESRMNYVLVDFVDNTIEYIRKDSDLLSAELVVPKVATKFEGRHVLIVVRGYHYKEDLAILGSYIREYRPLLVGVDGGADAIIEAGYKPDMIVGDMDSVSDTALTSGAEIVVHAYRDGNAPGTERVHSLGVDCVAFAASGTSEDIAMLLADDKGADLIVAVGTHDTVMEFLDKGRKGMASTFITRAAGGLEAHRRQGRVPSVSTEDLQPAAERPDHRWSRRTRCGPVRDRCRPDPHRTHRSPTRRGLRMDRLPVRRRPCCIFRICQHHSRTDQ